MDQCQICKLNHSTEDHECYICHQKGINSHKFIACPNRCKFCGGSHTISKHECFICHQKGPDSHGLVDCPERYDIDDFVDSPKKCELCPSFMVSYHLTKNHRCQICHQKGHDFLGCPKKCKFCHNFHLTKDHRCQICHKRGLDSHHFSACPKRCKFCGGSHTISKHECFICHQKGPDSHDFLDCPKKYKFWNNFYLTKDHGCPICHQKGENSHHYMECPKLDQYSTKMGPTSMSMSLSMFGMFRSGTLGDKIIVSPEGRVELDNSSKLKPIKEILDLEEYLDKEDGAEFVYGDTDSIMIKVSSMEVMEKLNESLETGNNGLELVSEKSFQLGSLGKKIYLH